MQSRLDHRQAKVRRAASASSRSAGVAAATGVRRAAWSRHDEVAALGVGDDGAGLGADEQSAEVVPRAVGAPRAVDVGVDDTGGDGAQVERGGTERPVLVPAEPPGAACPTARRATATARCGPTA